MLKNILIGILGGMLAGFTTTAQIVSAPKLQCVTLVGTSNLQLSWSLPVNSCGPFTAYKIYRDVNINGSFPLLATITDPLATTYIDPVIDGNVVPYYYFMVSDYDCPGATFLHSDTLDNLTPTAPTINYVTVNDNNAIINWNPSPSPETYGYIIYQFNGPMLTPSNVDTVGSSRVDLQACKLEYSIVSPK